MNNGWEGIPTDLPYAEISQDQLIQNMEVFTIIAGEITANKEFDFNSIWRTVFWNEQGTIKKSYNYRCT